MSEHPRITLVHATRVSIDPIETAAKELWPAAETVTMLEESLSIDRAKQKDLSPELSKRIVDLSKYAEATGADGVLFTCSAFGRAIEQANRSANVPVMKPNEAMFDLAFEHGDRIAMIYTFPPAAGGMEDEFREAAENRNSSAVITSYFCEGALAAKRSGNDELHNQLVAKLAAEIDGVDAILLAQFSMAGAATAVRSFTEIPVITSPDAAISEMKRRVSQAGETQIC